MENKIYLGTAYYPEHWDASDWEHNSALMNEGGLNFVRMAEFAWSKLEPAEGQYDFKWLDRAIDLCRRHNIEVMLCTPTAAPPPWMLHRHPDIVPVDINGRKMSATSTRHCYCPNSPAYQEYARRITVAMTEHYKHNDTVMAWQIDNEFGSSVRLSETCYCEHCAREFRKWLKSRYLTLDALNDAWGTIFSSNTYSSWEEILPPDRTVMTTPDPAHALDYRRFISDSYITFQNVQLQVIREISPGRPVTHNLAGDPIDYFNLFKDLDFAGWDNYPSFRTPSAPHLASANHDACRGYKNKNFWILEQQTKGQMHFLEPGYLRLYTYQGIGRGADLVCYFRWRLCRFGREQLRSGIIDWSGNTTRRYEEVKQTGAELQKISSELIGSACRAEAGILTSFDIRSAFDIQKNHMYMGTPVDYPRLMADFFYRPLFDRNISTDILNLQTCNLDCYKLILAPFLYLLDARSAARLKDYVRKGGILVSSVLSGYKDWNNNMISEALPGALTDLTGCTIKESNSFYHDPELNRVLLKVPGYPETESPATVWGELLHPGKAEVVGRYSTNFFKGDPAVTLNRYGKGCVLHIGTVLSNEAHDQLIDWAVHLSGIKTIESPDNVEISCRYKDAYKYVFILNHNETEKTVNVGGLYRDLLAGTESDQPIQVKGLDVRIIKMDV